jgi:uncharacterized membrane protein YhdT
MQCNGFRDILNGDKVSKKKKKKNENLILNVFYYHIWQILALLAPKKFKLVGFPMSVPVECYLRLHYTNSLIYITGLKFKYGVRATSYIFNYSLLNIVKFM